MRQIVATENLSVDGVMEAPENWAPPFETDDFHQEMFRGMDSSATMLFGRVTFEEFAAFWPDSDMEPFASHMRNVEKFVVSNTLTSAEWGSGNDVPIISGDIATRLHELKNEDGGDISVIGSGGLVRSLLSLGLLDRLTLCVYPTLVGAGKRLFTDHSRRSLELLEAKTFRGGISVLSYRPL